VAVSVAVVFWHTITLLAVGASGVVETAIFTVSLTEGHPALLSLTVTMYIPALFTFMEGVVSPVVHIYE
jgi:hypothetical protein